MAIYNHYVENSIATFDTEPTSVEDRAAWFETFSSVGPYRLLVVAEGQVAQRSATTAARETILAALELPEPARFFDFTIPSD